MILLRIIAFGSLPHAKQVMSSRWCKIPNPELKQLQKEKQPLLPQEYHEQGTFGMSQNGYWFQNFSLYCTSSYFIFNESKVIPQGRGLCHQRPTETDLERLKHMMARGGSPEDDTWMSVCCSSRKGAGNLAIHQLQEGFLPVHQLQYIKPSSMELLQLQQDGEGRSHTGPSRSWLAQPSGSLSQSTCMRFRKYFQEVAG